MGTIQNAINSAIGATSTVATVKKVMPAITSSYDKELAEKASYDEPLKKILGEEMNAAKQTPSMAAYQKANEKLNEYRDMMQLQREATLASRGSKGSPIDKAGDARKAQNFADFRKSIHGILGGAE